jgi:hypothetical protein
MIDQPLGDPAGIDGTDAPSPAPDPRSIVDTILNLDEILSGDVRRAEKTVYIYVRPDLAADIEELDAELATLIDDRGNPLEVDEALASEGRTARDVALEREAKASEMAASRRAIRLRQMPENEWSVFREKHLNDGDSTISDEVWNKLIAASAIAPRMNEEQVAQLRGKIGHPQLDVIASGSWDVNIRGGVSIPKSSISSVVLRRTRHEQS